MLLTMVLSSRAVDGWAEEWAGGRRCVRYGRIGGRCVRYGWIGGRKDGHKGGLLGPCEVWVDR